MKSLDELSKIRQKAEKKISKLKKEKEINVVIGMATCGISAGARPVLNAFVDEINKFKLENVSVTQTGCIGICRYEPIVEIYKNDKKTVYIEMNPEKAKEVVKKHIIEGEVVSKYTLSKKENN